MKPDKIRAIARKYTHEYKHEVIGGDDYISVNAANNVAVKTANAVVEEQKALIQGLYKVLKAVHRGISISADCNVYLIGPFYSPNSEKGQGGTIQMIYDAIKAYEDSEEK